MIKRLLTAAMVALMGTSFAPPSEAEAVCQWMIRIDNWSNPTISNHWGTADNLWLEVKGGGNSLFRAVPNPNTISGGHDVYIPCSSMSFNTAQTFTIYQAVEDHCPRGAATLRRVIFSAEAPWAGSSDVQTARRSAVQALVHAFMKACTPASPSFNLS